MCSWFGTMSWGMWSNKKNQGVKVEIFIRSVYSQDGLCRGWGKWITNFLGRVTAWKFVFFIERWCVHDNNLSSLSLFLIQKNRRP